MPGLAPKIALDDRTADVGDKLADALFAVASSFGKLSAAIDRHTALMGESGR